MVTLITGGAGFLGRGIMSLCNDEQYIVYSRDERKQDLCRKMFPGAVYKLGDINDFELLTYTLNRYDVDDVIHAAAMKYIPEAEVNVQKCIDVNLIGSDTVARACISAGVNRVVAISTDKASTPINVYGATKMLMERLWGEFALLDCATRFTSCRYGNVVGSTGSVIPLFIEQFKRDGKVKLTNPDMTRFWISIRKAVQLVTWALTVENGHMVVPKASAMTMNDLALSIAGSQANIELIGVRPGEKVHENMMHQYESVRAKDCIEYYDLGTEVVGEPFVLTSNNPHVWIDDATMRGYIQQAQALEV